MAQNDVEVGFAANLEGLKSGFSDAAGVVRQGTDAISGSTMATGAVMGAVAGAVTELTGRILNGLSAALTEASQKFTVLTKEVEGFRAVTGMSLEASSVMIDALGDIGIKSTEYEQIVRRTAMALRTKEEAFERLGVKVRNTKGEYLPMNEIIKNGLSTLMEYKEGTDRNAASMELFRMSWKQLEPMMRLSTELLESNAEQAEKFGMIVSQDDVNAMHALQLATADALKPLEGMSVTIGRALTPYLVDLAGILQTVLTGAFYIVTGAVKGFLTFLELLQNGLYVVSETALGMGRVVGSVFEAIWKAMTSKSPAEALGAIRNGFKQVEADAKLTLNNIVSHVEETNKRIANIWGLGTDAAAPPPSGTKSYQKKEKAGKSGAEEKDTAAADYMKQLQEEWETKKRIYEMENGLRKISKEQERDYWMSALGYMSNLTNSKQQVHAIEQKIRITHLDGVRKELEEEQAIGRIREQDSVREAQSSIAWKREELAQKAALGLISKEEELRQLRAFEIESQNIQRAAHAREMDALKDEPVKYAQMYSKLLEMRRTHDLNILKLDNQIKVASNKLWTDMFTTIRQAFTTSANGIIAGTQTLKGALLNIANAIGSALINKLAIEPLMNYLESQLKMTAATQTGVATRTAVQAEGAATGMAMSAGSIIKSIMNFAAETFAGVWAALSGIPFIGPALAAAQAPAAMATVAAVAGSVASSEQGEWRVPQDRLNLVHKDETILPSGISEKMRSFFEGKNQNQQVVFQVNAIDGASVKKFFLDNGTHLATALRMQARNFSPVK